MDSRSRLLRLPALHGSCSERQSDFLGGVVFYGWNNLRGRAFGGGSLRDNSQHGSEKDFGQVALFLLGRLRFLLLLQKKVKI